VPLLIVEVVLQGRRILIDSPRQTIAG
jgi:hypothetical protein